jgi:hypothetical protein
MAAAQDNTLTLFLLAVGAYFLYHQANASGAPAPPAPTGATGTTTAPATGSADTMLQCRYPDGTLVPIMAGNACPFSSVHGGQSTPCYPASFVGPLPDGTDYC